MVIRLHEKARTTQEIRREIQASDLPATGLAKIYGVHRYTIRKWRNQETVEEVSHLPHRLHATLSPSQEAIVVLLLETLLLPLDDLLAVIRPFLCPDLSRSALDRMLHRHGVTNLMAPYRSQGRRGTHPSGQEGLQES